MKVRQLGSSIGDSEIRQHLTTFLINDTIAIDAGCLGLLGPVSAQQSVTDVLISHSHIDHIATLPLFLDNVFRADGDSPVIHASVDVWDVLTRDLMNERLWPDLARIADGGAQFYSRAELRSEVPVRIGSLQVTPVAIDHIVPAFGFLIEDEQSAVVIATDTGPTDRIWQLANELPFRRKLKAVFLECSFPSEFEWLAVKSKHLCPQLFAEELGKLTPNRPWTTIAVHLKADLQEQTVGELHSLRIPELLIGGGDQTWNF